MKIDPASRFDGTVKDYHLYRAGYPPALFDWLFRTVTSGRKSKIADIGCGTGISTRALAEAGAEVTGVDPNREMLDCARSIGGGAKYREGMANDTGLTGRAFDLVTAAQSFHWFDPDTCLPEFRRILRSGGAVAAFWNCQENSPFLADYDQMLREHCTEYRGSSNWSATIERIRASSSTENVREAAFPNSQEFDADGLLGRVKSCSYVRHGVARPDRLEQAVRGLSYKHQAGGLVRMEYRTAIICWNLA